MKLNASPQLATLPLVTLPILYSKECPIEALWDLPHLFDSNIPLILSRTQYIALAPRWDRIALPSKLPDYSFTYRIDNLIILLFNGIVTDYLENCVVFDYLRRLLWLVVLYL